jgi:putative transposase
MEEAKITEYDVIGFVDQMAVEANSNTSRMWSFIRPLKEVATYLKTKATRFYTLNGHDVLEFPENNKKENFVLFMEKVRVINPFGRIIMILDNFRTHHAIIVKEKAEELNILLLHLPPYSPHLNPIEYVWKSIKRIISIISPLLKEELENNIQKSFYELTESLSFAKNWIKNT